MKKINYLKFSLDIIMVIIFTLLFKKMVLGLAFHEIAGLVIGAIVLVHCGLNWKWIKGVTLKLFNKKTLIKTKIGYILNILLIITVVIIIISGIFISKIVFRNFTLPSVPLLRTLHVPASYFLLMLIGIHLGLHWNWVMMIFKKLFKIPEKKIFNYIAKAMMILVLAFGIYSFNSVGYISKLSLSKAHGMEGKINGEFNGKEGFEGKEGLEGKKGRGEKEGIEKGDLKKPEEGNLAERPTKGEGGQAGNINILNILNVIIVHLGVISIFSIATYYLEKLIKIRKKVS